MWRLLFALLWLALAQADGNYMLVTRYVEPTDPHYLPPLSPPCDWPRWQKYMSLPMCESSGYSLLEYKLPEKLLILNYLGYKDEQCTLPVEYYRQTLVRQDMCTTDYYQSWYKMHVYDKSTEPNDLESQQAKDQEFPNWRTSKDVGRNVSLQTFSWNQCQHEGPLMQASVGTCYQRKYFGSYAFVGFRNDSVLVGYVWEGNKNCTGMQTSWMYIVKSTCSQPTYDYADGPSSWIGWW